MTETPVVIKHNLNPSKFVYLWMKYVRGVNLERHCTNCLHGVYGRKLSKRNNPSLVHDPVLTLDEVPVGSYKAIYICGVAGTGYHSKPKTNYPHNLHLAIVPKAGAQESHQFEGWVFEITNGQISRIPTKDDLPTPWSGLADEYTTCRIFRWAVANRQLLSSHTS